MLDRFLDVCSLAPVRTVRGLSKAWATGSSSRIGLGGRHASSSRSTLIKRGLLTDCQKDSRLGTAAQRANDHACAVLQSGGSRSVTARALGGYRPVRGDPQASQTGAVAADRGPIVSQGQQHQRRDPPGLVLESIYPRRPGRRALLLAAPSWGYASHA